MFIKIYMMLQAYRKSISMKIIQLYSKTLRARKRKSIHLQPLLSYNSLAECFAKKKIKQYFHDHADYDYSREYKSPLQQLLTLHIHITPDH